VAGINEAADIGGFFFRIAKRYARAANPQRLAEQRLAEFRDQLNQFHRTFAMTAKDFC
jgi:hypothetical protein